MEKGLLFFTLSMVAVWLILDDFFGSKRVSNMAMKMTPDINTPLDTVKEGIDKATESVKDGVSNYKKGQEKLAKGAKDLVTGKTWEQYLELKKKHPEKAKQIEKSMITGTWDSFRSGLSNIPGIGGFFK